MFASKLPVFSAQLSVCVSRVTTENWGLVTANLIATKWGEGQLSCFLLCESEKRVTTELYLCIGCPLGCRLEVDEEEDGHIVEVRGFSCKRGKEYAFQEHMAPQRMVTTTVAIAGGLYPRLPVRTDRAVPKERIDEICQQLRQLSVRAPIHRGDIILPNVMGLDVNIIASRTMGAL